MEKLVYLFWTDAPATELGERISHHLQTADSIAKWSLQLDDKAVADGASLRIGADLPSAFASLWLDSAQQREAIEQSLTNLAPRCAGYLVTESAPLTGGRVVDGRVEGFCQIALLQTPLKLTREQWLHWWLDHHTKVAIDTQSTFAYRQNIVVRVLTPDAPSIDAIVEEGFPATALTSQHAFYDAVGDDDLLAVRTQAMMESCTRFIDFDNIRVLPTSEYRGS